MKVERVVSFSKGRANLLILKVYKMVQIRQRHGNFENKRVLRGYKVGVVVNKSFAQICRMLQINSFTLTFGQTLVILF